MTTAEVVTERALELAEQHGPTDEAVEELLGCCAEKRVAVVMARRRLEETLEDGTGTGATQDAIELIDLTLARGDWAD